MTRFLPRLVAALLVLVGLAKPALADPLSVTGLTRLSFGKLAVGGSGGTVTVSPSGVRTTSGTIWPLGSSFASPATFAISGTPATSFSISLPGSVVLTSGTHQLYLDTFVSTPQGSGSFNADGKATVTVGATLHTSAQQATGAYTGTFDLLVSYE